MLLKSSRLLLVFAIARAIVAVPLGIDYDKTAGLTPAQTANKGRLDQATAQANAQVQKMREGINKYKANDPRAKELYEVAFGKNADVNIVDDTITKLEHGTLKAKVATHPFQSGEIAAINWNGKTPGRVLFGSKFHGGTMNNDGRAGTIIHEATHQFSRTGDELNKSKKIIRPGDGGSSQPTGKYGYTSNQNMHKTVAEVNADTLYKDARDSTKNMHYNAESYAVFASLCSQPGALRRRDIHLYNRALRAGDDKQLIHLARRNKCKLPKDYFAKKAAAKKAAGAKGKQATTKGTAKGLSKKPVSGATSRHGVKPATPKGKVPVHSTAKTRLGTTHSPMKPATHGVTKPRVRPGAHSPAKRPVVHAAGAAKRPSVRPTIHSGAKRPVAARPGAAHPGAKRPAARPVAHRPATRPGVHAQRPLNRPGAHATAAKRPVSRPGAKSPAAAKRPVARPGSKPHARPVSHAVAKRPVARPGANSQNRPVSHAAKRPSARPVKKPTAHSPAKRPLAHKAAAKRPAVRPVPHAAAKRPASRPASRPSVKKPIARPAVRPASKPTVGRPAPKGRKH